jgi:hypothetical protein
VEQGYEGGGERLDRTTDLQIAADRVSIQDVMARYTAAVDQHRWDLFAEVFEDGADVDFVANGGIRDSYPAIAEYLKTAMSGFVASQHYLTNFVTDVRGDEAQSRFYVFTQMITLEEGGEKILSDGGYYDATFVRNPDGWRVRKLTGGIVWWDGSVPTHLPWYGTATDRFAPSHTSDA